MKWTKKKELKIIKIGYENKGRITPIVPEEMIKVLGLDPESVKDRRITESKIQEHFTKTRIEAEYIIHFLKEGKFRKFFNNLIHDTLPSKSAGERYLYKSLYRQGIDEIVSQEVLDRMVKNELKNPNKNRTQFIKGGTNLLLDEEWLKEL
jgi:hypothetical protein